MYLFSKLTFVVGPAKEDCLLPDWDLFSIFVLSHFFDWILRSTYFALQTTNTLHCSLHIALCRWGDHFVMGTSTGQAGGQLQAGAVQSLYWTALCCVAWQIVGAIQPNHQCICYPANLAPSILTMSGLID